jgi:hypothetical protein
MRNKPFPPKKLNISIDFVVVFLNAKGSFFENMSS